MNCQKFVSILCYNACTEHELVDLTILWSNRQTGTICHKMECGSTLSIGVYYKIQILQEILKTQNQNQAEFSAFCPTRTFVPISWMCKKQKVSISQLHRIKDHIIGCWFAHGTVHLRSTHGIWSLKC